MKLASYRLDGQARYGVATPDGLIDAAFAGTGFGTLKQLLAGDGVATLRAALEQAQKGGATLSVTPLADVELLPVIPDPDKILCVGINYRSHREETKREPSAYPTIFTRFADTQIAHAAPVVIPEVAEQFDYEGELAVVIGRAGHKIAEADAMDFVAGVSCYNDLSVREWQRHTGQWTPGKNFPGTGAFGPWMTTMDEIEDLSGVRLITRVNGDVRQDALLSQMIFSIPELIAYISTFTSLAPGDVIVTGTPGGVGLFRDPPEFLKSGDVVEVEIDHVGILENAVR
jgi:2-keto-4-pentenoate hydratase/2-oxohepta-3-ene-1,7-dioic acid hydratase in catechol pathway